MAELTATRKILVVEDEPFLRELVCKALDEAGFITVPAGTAADAAKLFRLSDPDGAVIDLDLGTGPNGLILAARLSRDVPGIPIIFLTVWSDPRSVEGPQIPVSAHFVNKRGLRDIDEFVAIVDRALRGNGTAPTRHDKTNLNKLLDLTQAQIDVLRLISEGFTNEQIAQARGTSLRAAELLIGKTLKRIGVDELAGNRRVLAARKFS